MNTNAGNGYFQFTLPIAAIPVSPHSRLRDTEQAAKYRDQKLAI
ncbi:hypothetical protein [Acetobacter malorum]|nr:hypothetical protein [Acetobacter malorum]